MSDICKALSEVDLILEYSDADIKNRISTKFIKFIEKYKDNTYKIKFDKSKNLNEQNLMPETREILALIYRDYLCDSQEERKRLIEYNEEKLKEINSNYDVEKIFKERTKKDEISKEQSLIVVKKEKWYNKIFSLLKKIFKR